MRLIIKVLSILLVAGGMAQAEPSSQPARPTTRPQAQHKRAVPTAGQQSLWAMVQRWLSESGEVRWSQAQVFMKQHSPHRWRAFETLERGSRAWLDVRRYILARYNEIAPLRKRDPDIYEMRLREIQLEDDIFGLTTERRVRGDREAFDQQLRKLASDLVDTRLKIREMRITKLEKTIALEKKRLERDHSRRDQLVRNEIHQVETHGVPPRRPRGGVAAQETPASRPASTRPASTRPASTRPAHP